MTLTVGSICTGYAGIELALELAGIDHTLAWVSEIDDTANNVLAHNFPHVPNIGDINDANPPAVDVITAGFPCFGVGTIITTRRGLIPIEDVEVGDEVLTHRARWRAVTSTMQRDGAPTREIKAPGIPSTITTDEHPYFASKQGRVWNNDRRSYDRTFGEPEWVEAKDLTSSHRVAQILPPVDPTIYGSAEFWYIVGRYLADGWRVRRLKTGSGKPANGGGRVVICCAHQEADELLRRIRKAGFEATTVTERTVTKFHIVNSSFYRYLAQFGDKAHGKTLPGWALGLDRQRAEATLAGYLDGDGCRYAGGDQATTVSRGLALSVAALAHRARGVVASVTIFKRPPTCVIEGRVVNQKDSYTMRIPDTPRQTFVDNDGIGWRLIASNEPTGKLETVYNISVEEDESYVADGAVVHNCQDISVAGRQAGIHGERSGLWWRIRDVVGDLRPRFVVLENVAAIVTNGGTAVVGSLAELGYDCRWGIVRASDAGAPHQRARWFCLATDTRGVGRWSWEQVPQRRPAETQRPSGGVAADTDRAGWDKPITESRRGSTVIAHGERSVADTDSARPQGRQLLSERGNQRAAGPRGVESAADTENVGCERAGQPRRWRAGSENFGRYWAAVHRWEQLTRPAPPPTDDGRLNPRFVEWMQGLPDGWVNHGSRAAQLRCLGNGVVPQQAALALRMLLSPQQATWH